MGSALQRARSARRKWYEALNFPGLGVAILVLLAALWMVLNDSKDSKANLAAQPVTNTLTKGLPKAAWTNSLGMQLVPLGSGTTRMSVWKTRVQDFTAFVEASGHDATQGLLVWTPKGWQQTGETWRKPGFDQSPEHPVVGVNWHDARAFCEWLTKREHTTGTLAPDQHYRLPTNAEWDVAAGPSAYPWGEGWPPPAEAGNYSGEEAANQGTPMHLGRRDAFPFTAPVGSFKSNRLGLFDLGGNAWEWIDEGQPSAGQHEPMRGCGWLHESQPATRSTHRQNGLRDGRYNSIGFRIVCSSK
jgi:formylglycine-generating enzyme required for sulfatase activity